MAAPPGAYHNGKFTITIDSVDYDHLIAFIQTSPEVMAERFFWQDYYLVKTDEGDGIIGLNIESSFLDLYNAHAPARIGKARKTELTDYVFYNDAGLNTRGMVKNSAVKCPATVGLVLSALFCSAFYDASTTYGFTFQRIMWNGNSNQQYSSDTAVVVQTGSVTFGSGLAAAASQQITNYISNAPDLSSAESGMAIYIYLWIDNPEGRFQTLTSAWVTYAKQFGYSASYLDYNTGAGALAENTTIYTFGNWPRFGVNWNIFTDDAASTLAPNGTYKNGDYYYHVTNGIVTFRGSVWGPEVTNTITITKTKISDNGPDSTWRFTFTASMPVNTDLLIGGDLIVYEYSAIDTPPYSPRTDGFEIQIDLNGSQNYFEIVSYRDEAPGAPYIDWADSIGYFQGMTYIIDNQASQYNI